MKKITTNDTYKLLFENSVNLVEARSVWSLILNDNNPFMAFSHSNTSNSYQIKL